MSKSILISMPTYGGMITTFCAASLVNVTSVLDRAGIPHDFNLGTNESLIQRARNAMSRAFLETDHDYLFWIDSDIEFKPGDVAKLWDMCEGPTQADIAVGVYAMKKRDKQWFAAWVDGKLIMNLDQFDGPIKVDFAGTGFMLIKREVIEVLAEKQGSYQAADGKRDPQLFMCPVFNDGLESEDFHFCRIARENGFFVWMDPRVRLGHYGQYRYG